MYRAQVRLSLLSAGFLILLVELAFALYCSVHLYFQLRTLSTFSPPGLLVKAHLPSGLLALATILAGIVLWRALRGRAQRTSYLAVLAPVCALLVGYASSVTPGALLHVTYAGLPWAAPIWWAHDHGGLWAGGLSIPLLAGTYLVAAVYIAMALTPARKHSKSHRVSGPPEQPAPVA